MSFTMEDFNRQYIKEHFPHLTPQEREEVLQALPAEERLAGLSAEQIRQYLDQLTAGHPTRPRKGYTLSATTDGGSSGYRMLRRQDRTRRRCWAVG
jgi:hypothetical protein